MSYCVNCGVELDASARECALCNTPVINPKELEKMRVAKSPFPREEGQVEAVKRKDMAILISVVAVATAVVCAVLNLLVLGGAPWSLAVIGVCGIFWVFMIPAVIYTRLPVYLYLFFDSGVIAIYLYMLTYLTDGKEWFLGLGLPIVALVMVVSECFALCFKKLPKSFLATALYFFTAVALLCIGVEILIDLYLRGEVQLLWSAVVLTVCTVLDVAIITMLSLRRLRSAVRRRLHF